MSEVDEGDAAAASLNVASVDKLSAYLRKIVPLLIDDGEGETCFSQIVKTFFQFLRWTVTCLNSDVLQVSHRVFQKNGLIGTKILQLF